MKVKEFNREAASQDRMLTEVHTWAAQQFPDICLRSEVNTAEREILYFCTMVHNGHTHTIESRTGMGPIIGTLLLIKAADGPFKDI